MIVDIIKIISNKNFYINLKTNPTSYILNILKNMLEI